MRCLNGSRWLANMRLAEITSECPVQYNGRVTGRSDGFEMPIIHLERGMAARRENARAPENHSWRRT